MSVMQMDRDLRNSGAGVVGIEVIVEAHHRRLTVPLQNRGALDQSIKSPYIAGGQIGVKRYRSGLGVDRILLLRQKFIPALMVSARGLPRSNIRRLCGSRVEICRLQRRRNRKLLKKCPSRRTSREGRPYRGLGWRCCRYSLEGGKSIRQALS